MSELFGESQEEMWARAREECLSRFNQAVASGKRREYGPSEAIIGSVREKHGDAAAEIAATELRNAIRREARPKK